MSRVASSKLLSMVGQHSRVNFPSDQRVTAGLSRLR